MGVCYLVGAGDFYGQINKMEDDIIIAADGGYDSLKKRGYTPDLLIGDFDSIMSDIPDGIRTLPCKRSAAINCCLEVEQCGGLWPPSAALRRKKASPGRSCRQNRLFETDFGD